MILNFVVLKQTLIQYMFHRYYVKKKPRKTPVYQPTDKAYDFLKNWRVVRYYIQKRYNIKLSELEMLLYLYDENVFDKETFNDFAESMTWDKGRLSDLIDRELIQEWRPGKKAKHRRLWTLSQKAKLICSHTYKKLLGFELISEDPYRNKIMKGDNYMDKIYRSLIKKMNHKTSSASHKEE